MSTGKKVLAFVVSSLVISFVGLAIWNRVARKSSLAAKALGASAA